jgi:hypothetical protein
MPDMHSVLYGRDAEEVPNGEVYSAAPRPSIWARHPQTQRQRCHAVHCTLLLFLYLVPPAAIRNLGCGSPLPRYSHSHSYVRMLWLWSIVYCASSAAIPLPLSTLTLAQVPCASWPQPHRRCVPPQLARLHWLPDVTALHYLVAHWSTSHDSRTKH